MQQRQLQLPNPSGQWCSQNGMPSPQWMLSAGRSLEWIQQNKPNHSSSLLGGQMQTGLSRRRSESASRNQSRRAVFLPHIHHHHHLHLENEKHCRERGISGQLAFLVTMNCCTKPLFLFYLWWLVQQDMARLCLSPWRTVANQCNSWLDGSTICFICSYALVFQSIDSMVGLSDPGKICNWHIPPTNNAHIGFPKTAGTHKSTWCSCNEAHS